MNFKEALEEILAAAAQGASEYGYDSDPVYLQARSMVEPLVGNDHVELPDEVDELLFEHCDGTQPGQKACFLTHLKGTCDRPVQRCLEPTPNGGSCSLPQGHDA